MAITVFSETKRVKINTDCIENPVCLRWLNELGGWDVWVFGKKQIKTLTVGDSQLSKRYETDLINGGNPLRKHSLRATENMILGANNLNKAKYAPIFDLVKSPCVQMLTNNDTWESDGAVFREVYVKDNSFEIEDTAENQINIEFEILLSELNTQSYV